MFCFATFRAIHRKLEKTHYMLIRANKHIDYFKENAALVHTGLRVIGKPNVRGSHFFGGGNAKEPQAVF